MARRGLYFFQDQTSLFPQHMRPSFWVKEQKDNVKNKVTYLFSDIALKLHSNTSYTLHRENEFFQKLENGTTSRMSTPKPLDNSKMQCIHLFSLQKLYFPLRIDDAFYRLNVNWLFACESTFKSVIIMARQ